MPTTYLQKHVLVCVGKSCGPQGGEDVRDALKKELRARDLRGTIRDGECSCIGLCGDGVNAVIWPEGTYLADLTKKDVPRLVDYLAGDGADLSDLISSAGEKIEDKLSHDKR